MDRYCPPHYVKATQEALDDNQALLDYCHSLSSPLITPVITPRSAWMHST